MGTEYGLIDVNELLPRRQMVVRAVNDLAAQCRIHLREEYIQITIKTVYQFVRAPCPALLQWTEQGRLGCEKFTLLTPL